MRKIVFATNNPNKLREIREILGSRFEVVSLSEIGCHDDIPETGDTLEANALQKAQYVHDHYGLDCFADDTGLEVDALGGAPGVHSARYAEGTDHDSEANMQRLLRELAGHEDRQAHFRTVIALIMDGQTHLFEGRVAGRNDKIVESLRKRDKGDGTAPLNGKNGGAPGKQKSQSIFDIANEAM